MSKEVDRIIGGQIARLRQEKGLTQAQLAEAIGVANETISRLERGVSIPSLSTIEEISLALNVRLKDLFDFDYTPQGNKKTSPSEREVTRIVALLKNKKIEELRLAHTLLRNLLLGIKKLP